MALFTCYSLLLNKMGTYVLMKILESAPSRYDRGIRILTLGKLDSAYDRLISHIKKGWKVLDIGCGTGALTLRAALKGANVKGIDVNPQMLEIAQKLASEANLAQNIELCERGVVELKNEKLESYDAVMSGLCFSELSEEELTYTLKEIKRILKPDGILLVADEVKPKGIINILLHWLIKIPLVAITYIITQTTTKAVKALPEKIEKEGLIIESIKLNRIEDFIELIAKKSKEG